jgi:hypothetical protein
MKIPDNLKSSVYNFNKFLISYFFPGTLFLAIFLYGFDWLFTKFILLNTDTAGYSKINRLISYEGEEMPIFGASRAKSSYVPDSIAPSAYNYGLNEACFLSTNAFLNIELHKKKKSPVIIDFTYWYWNTIGDIADYIPFVDNKNIYDLLRETGVYKVTYSIPGLRYFGYYDYYTKEYLNQFAQYNKIVIKGFTHPIPPPVFDEKKFKEVVIKRLESPLVAAIDKKQSDMLIKQVTLHPERHFYFTISPFHGSFFKSLKRSEELELFFDSLGRLPNVTFVNYGKVNYPDSLFLDTTHLNYYGALVFSKELSKKIF